MKKKKKQDKSWFLVLVVLGMAYLAWSIYQLLTTINSACTPGINILKPTLFVICNATSTFFIPFGIVIGLISMIVGIWLYANKKK